MNAANTNTATAVVMSTIEHRPKKRKKKRWRNLWRFYSGSLNFEAAKESGPYGKKDKYVKWVTRVLKSNKAPTIEELRVCCELTELGNRGRFIDRWIKFALKKKKVKRLELDVTPRIWMFGRASEHYNLERKFCDLSEIKFLTSLCLKHVEVSGQVLESFLSNCQLLKTLHVSHSKQHINHINVVCGSSLSSLSFKHVDVSRRVLEAFLSNCLLLEALHVSHSKQLVDDINVVCGSSLSSLCFEHVKVSSRVLESFLSNCPLLETLHVSDSERLTDHRDVSLSSLSLKHLHISSCNWKGSIEIYAPNLVSLEPDELIWSKIFLKYVPQLRDVSHCGPWDYIIRYHGNQGLVGFPSCLGTCVSQLVNLSVKLGLEIYGVKILRCLILPNLRNLTCKVRIYSHIRKKVELVNLLSLVDSSPMLHKFRLELRIDNPRRVLKTKRKVWKVIEEVETMYMNRKGYDMLSLREVEIVGFVGCKADSAFLIYLLKTATNLENIVVNTCSPQEQEEARKLAHDLVSAYIPQGAKFAVL